ncbi:unnamed protein product [Urochloa humidicola]
MEENRWCATCPEEGSAVVTATEVHGEVALPHHGSDITAGEEQRGSAMPEGDKGGSATKAPGGVRPRG